ncbi:tetratricopeptide repeat protein [Roseicyclus mahoneyensis]|uniref:Tetratricopeptide repeat protein n=1 Tax=Roseicyclus mahoneyensis TaxID=164332 RepID=A0A316GGQ4_9RHOB|nr:tetratricopeptide repeat protein [Roseicyclus mahoneyensis]PWK59106.1 hypothetical protein C7455_10928 [Roseicyclus mahoneyensis]
MTQETKHDDKVQLATVLRDVAKRLERIEGDQGWLASLRFGVAGGLAEAGEDKLAEAGFRRILSDTPRHLWAWVGLIDVLIAQSDVVKAAATGRDALGHLPDVVLLRRKTAEAVERAEGPAAALDVLTASQDLGADDAAYAIGLHRAAGTVIGAGDLCSRLLHLRPGDGLALLARIEIGLQSGDGALAVAAAEDALVHRPDHPEIVLRAAQAHRLAGDFPKATVLAEAVPPDTPFARDAAVLRAMLAEDIGASAAARLLWAEVADLNLPDLTPLAQAALARLEGQMQGEPVAAPVLPDADPATLYTELEAALAEGPDAAEAVLRRLVTHPDLPWYLAFRLVARLWQAGAAREAAALSAAFDAAHWPVADRQAFAIEDLLLRRGPRAALDWVRAHPVARRDREASERLGRVLINGGASRLAGRYLFACCHRWPQDAQMLALATDALVASGRPDRALRLIDGPCRAVPAGHRLASQVSALVAQGQIDAAVAACTQAQAAGGIAVPRVALIELQVLSGNLAAAEASMSALSVTDGPLEEALICRPRATRVGSLLNEARILAAAGGDTAEAATAGNRAAAHDFFLPARAVLLERSGQALGAGADVPGLPVAPDLVHLIWPGVLPLPEEVGRILTAWRTNSRREVRLHDPRSASGWLKERVGVDAARALSMVSDPDQKVDLMLLGALLIHGGVAAAAHQWPRGGVDGLVDTVVGAGLFLEGSGAVSMDVVIAAPDHPVIAMALERAVASCLSRENDHRWFKTGPGLMTRALATCLTDPARDPCDVTLRPVSALRSVVSPHRVWAAPNAGLRGSPEMSTFATAVGRVLSGDTGAITAVP